MREVTAPRARRTVGAFLWQEKGKFRRLVIFRKAAAGADHLVELPLSDQCSCRVSYILVRDEFLEVAYVCFTVALVGYHNLPLVRQATSVYTRLPEHTVAP